MALIITATDYSDIAANAVHYACQLAQEQNAELVVLHAFNVPLTFTEGPIPANFVNDMQEDAQDVMNQLLIDLYKAYPSVNIKGEVAFGDIIEAIEEYATVHGKPWMIIVGNSTTGETSSWPDSTVIDAFKNARYPVLAIPPGTTYKPVKKLCFAFDNKHSGNIPAVLRLVDITQLLNAELHILTAITEEQRTNGAELDPTVRNLLAPAHPHYTIVADANIEHAIETFVAGNSVDMLVMIPRKHSFFEGLFHKSHTKAVAHNSNIPILALHDAQS